MTHYPISTEDVSYRKRVPVLDSNIAYVDAGEGDPIVLSIRSARRGRTRLLATSDGRELRMAAAACERLAVSVGTCLTPELEQSLERESQAEEAQGAFVARAGAYRTI